MRGIRGGIIKRIRQSNRSVTRCFSVIRWKDNERGEAEGNFSNNNSNGSMYVYRLSDKTSDGYGVSSKQNMRSVVGIVLLDNSRVRIFV